MTAYDPEGYPARACGHSGHILFCMRSTADSVVITIQHPAQERKLPDA
jgi:hypothetical protein